MFKKILGYMCLVLTLGACATGAGGGGDSITSKESSSPLNRREEVEYKAALLRCYKTGGTRIVKISGNLRCF